MGNAGPVIQAALADGTRTTLTRLLLAGRCLTEKITLAPDRQRLILQGLGAYFLTPTAQSFSDISALVSHLGNEQIYDWFLENFDDLVTADEAQSLQTPLDQLAQGTSHPLMQQVLRRAMYAGDDMNARQLMGSLLGGIGDPRDLDEMVTVPAGKFTMGGHDDDDEKPVHEVDLDAYQIAKYPVTNAQYQRFVLAIGHPPAESWPNGEPEPRKRNHPVVGVSWHDANQYCVWLTQVQGRRFRLPSEAEWEKAARGTKDAREYPWGDEAPTEYLGNYALNIGDTTPVGLYPDGASPYGCLDMAGNVWEWTSSRYKAYPYDPHDGREDPEDDGFRTWRGGAFGNSPLGGRCAYRNPGYPVSRNNELGFRVMSPGAVDR